MSLRRNIAGRTVGVTLGAVLGTGCYTLQPVPETALTAERPIAFDVSDVGRVALGGSMGPSIKRIEGRLVRRADDGYMVAVSSVDYLSGGSQAWSGEAVLIKPEYIGISYQRRLSKSRTVAASAVGLGALAVIVTRTLVGSGNADNPTPPRDSIGTTHRGVRP